MVKFIIFSLPIVAKKRNILTGWACFGVTWLFYICCYFFHRHVFWGWYLTRGCHGYSLVGTTHDSVENLKCRNPIGKCILLMSSCVWLLPLNYLSLLFLLFGKWRLILIDDMTACPWIILYCWFFNVSFFNVSAVALMISLFIILFQVESSAGGGKIFNSLPNRPLPCSRFLTWYC